MASEHTDRPRANGNAVAIRELVGPFANVPGGLLPALHAVQRAVGYVPADAVAEVARTFNLSRAEVHGVISFYHFFRDRPAGQHVIHLCRAEACQSMGARYLADHVRAALKVDWHETTGDGRYTLKPVYCLGNCACAPAIMIDETVHGRVTPESFDELLD